MVLAAEEDGVEVLDELMELYAACLVAPVRRLCWAFRPGLPA